MKKKTRNVRAVIEETGLALPGMIHLWCPLCGNVKRNTKRGEYEPREAEIVAANCRNCDYLETTYYDSLGELVT